MKRRYVLAWFGMMVLAILNGALREILYAPMVGHHTAHQISTVTLLAALGGYIFLLNRQWPFASRTQAWMTGVLWIAMTLVFEFGLGLLRGASWSELLEAYDILEGRLWVLVPLWIFTGPYFIYRLNKRRHGGATT